MKVEEHRKQDSYHLFQEALCIQHHFCLQEQPGLLHEMFWPPPKKRARKLNVVL